MLEKCTVLFTPDTVMRWYNKLIAQKYDSSKKRGKPGRPQITPEVVKLIIKFKQENPRWGYQKITDQIIYLGYKISKSTVKNILVENGFNTVSRVYNWTEIADDVLDVYQKVGADEC